MPKRKTSVPKSGIFQRISISYLPALTGYTTPNAFKNSEPYSLFADQTFKKITFRVSDVCLLFGYTPPQLFNFLKYNDPSTFGSMTDEELERAHRLSAENIMERLPFFVRTIEDWKQRRLKEVEDSFAKKEKDIIKKYGKNERKLQERLRANNVALKQQTTRVLKTYNSIKNNAESVIGWLAKTYPDLVANIPQETREWLEQIFPVLKEILG